jgi:hypothetical protein
LEDQEIVHLEKVLDQVQVEKKEQVELVEYLLQQIQMKE